jgi:hypothetical protein
VLIKVSEATPRQLNYLVAEALGRGPMYDLQAFGTTFRGWWLTQGGEYERMPSYSTDWAIGGPILSKEHISRTIDHSGLWIAYWTDGYTDGDEGKKWMHCDRSELVAGLRCYVASELGYEVEIPEGLC